ncbi:MAG: EthD domain-containing protein [Alphaproteobacteria bacterium]
MIKVVVAINRKPGMDVEAFQDHWLNQHPEPILKLAGLRRYVQSHVRPSGYRGGRELVHDGIAELWFDDMAALKATNGTPEMAAVAADEDRFIDPNGRVLLVCDEHVIVDNPPPANAIKNVEFIHRKQGMSVADYQRCWRDVHGPLAAKIPSIRRYVQSHCRPGGYRDGREPTYDGIAVTWFESTDAMRQGATSDAYAATRADEPNFIDTERLNIILTTEHVILEG